jgi:hypothetical protein
MPIKFAPNFEITPKIANLLIIIEGLKVGIMHLHLNPMVLKSLRETAKLFTTHYSTVIEGNQLTEGEVQKVLLHGEHFPGPVLKSEMKMK